MSNKQRSWRLASALGCALAIAVPWPAFAGSITSGHHVFTDWGLHGLESSTWNDDGKSPSGTWIKLTGCHFNDSFTGNPEPEVQMIKKRTLQPDVKFAAKRFTSCKTAASGNWGNQASGTYFFKITDFDPVVNDTTQLHVAGYEVDY